MDSIPTVNLGPFGRSSASENARIADKLGAHFREIGFVAVTEHGVDPLLITKAFDLARRVFEGEMSEDARLAYEFPDEGRQVGYTPAKTEKSVGQDLPNNMRFWHVNDPRAEVRNAFPTQVPEFGPTMLRLHGELKRVGTTMMRALAIHLGREPEFFTPWVETGQNLLRVIHYPALTGEELEPRSGEHTDINLLTVLVPATQSGLQVQRADGKWIDAQNPEGSLVVNMGDMLQLHTFGELPSTRHRVVNPGKQTKSRYSMPLFLHPHKKVSLVNANAFLMRRLREIELLKALPPNQVDYM